MSDLVIGIEVHVQLLTKTKMFCGCKNGFGDPPNTNVCPVCLGLPGALPAVNGEAVRMGLMIALALGCAPNKVSTFYRKNYFYPDLPKGYQITHYTQPLGENGSLEMQVGKETKEIKIRRVHIEEDAGKMFHAGDITTSSFSLVDFNRCGAPLAEIVTEPCLTSPEEAQAYLSALRNLVRFIGVSTGNMEEGALRCDVNISVRNPDGSFGTKVEVKNLNSFRHARRALEHEAKRQREAIARGKTIVAETRHLIESKGETATMRSKEELNDYRYFPEPDLPPLELDDAFIEQVKSAMPQTPKQVSERLQKKYGLSKYDAGVLTSDIDLNRFFEETVRLGANPKRACNWLTVEIPGFLGKDGREISETKLTPKLLCSLVGLVQESKITNQSAKEILPDVLDGIDPEKIAAERNLIVVTDESSILPLVLEAIEKNPNQAMQYKSGKTQLIGFFVGQVLKASSGKVPAELVKKLLERELSK